MNRRRAVLLFVGLLFFLAFLFQGSRGIYAPDEGFYVCIAQGMAHTEDYIVPRLQYEPWLDKPPLTYWGIASGISIFGVNNFGARVFHGLCFLLTTVIVLLLGRSMWGNRTGYLAGILYMTMLLPFVAGNVVTPDTPLTLFVAAAFYAFHRTVRSDPVHVNLWKLLTFLCISLGFLTKGPAIFLPLAAMIVFLALRKSLFRYFLDIPTMLFLLFAVALGASWYVVITQRLPHALAYIWDNQVVGRTISARYARNPGFRGALIYIPVILGGTLPWSVFWFFRASKHGNPVRRSARLRKWLKNPDNLLLATWIAIPLVVLCLASSKLPLYALPIFPALALLTAHHIMERFPGLVSGRHRFGLKPVFLAGILIGAVCLAGLKYIAAGYPSRQNMQMLYHAIQPHLPEEPHEILAVEQHLEGLGFYDNLLVERLTVSKNPYPFFVLPESLDNEIDEIRTSPLTHLFICRKEMTKSLTADKLRAAGISFTSVSLPNQRCMMICDPPTPDKTSTRLAALGDSGHSRFRGDSLSTAAALKLMDAEKSLGGVILMGGNLRPSLLDSNDFTEAAEEYFEEPFHETISRDIPFFAVLGASDHIPRKLMEFELHYPLFGMKGRRYYSRELGNGRLTLFVLDASLLPESSDFRMNDQIEWLEDALDGSNGKWKIVALGQQPPMENPETGTAQSSSSDLMDWLSAHGVDIILKRSPNPDADNRLSRVTFPAARKTPVQIDVQPPGFILLELTDDVCVVTRHHPAGQTEAVTEIARTGKRNRESGQDI